MAAGWQIPGNAWIFAGIGGRRLLLALLLTLALAVAARRLRAVTFSGAITGAILAFVLYLGGGSGMFASLVVVFLLAAGSTRLGYWRKQRLGVAENRSGRTGLQVFANVAVAAGMALLALIADHPEGWLIASTAALAEAAADTVSSEFGQAVSRHSYLITDFRPVSVGTDGGISLWGTLAGASAALLVSATALLTQVIPLHWLLPVTGIGVLGMFLDSFLGATLERRELINNHAVNFTSTACAALITVAFYWSRHGQYWLT